MEEQKSNQNLKKKEEKQDDKSRSPPSLPLGLLQHQRLREATAPSLPPPPQSPPDSATVSSIPDSHGSSPHTLTPTPSATPVAAVAVEASKVEHPFGIINGDVEEQKLGESRRRLRPNISNLRRSKIETLVRRALLGFRVSAFVFCLVSFSIMAADRDQGWAMDSFYKYKEFRYCFAVNVLGFMYSGFQMCDLAYQLGTGRRKSRHNMRHFLDFGLDQMLAYLLASASSSASIRVDDWLSNWGGDKFPDMARASVASSFVAFAAFALCSLASGYSLCTLRSL